MSEHVLSGWSAARLQAGWSARRLLRGRMLWLAGIFALGPILAAAAIGQSGRQVPWEVPFMMLVFLSCVVTPLFAASSVADEIEDRTFTYLWSRPLPRWSMLAGKLLATIPITAAILAVSAALVFQLGQRGVAPAEALALPRTLGAVALAAFALSITSSSVAVLMPRHGLGVAYAYLILDLTVAAMPFSITNLSIIHHVQIVGGLVPHELASSPASSVVWLAGISLVWLALGLRRISRSEFASGDK